MRSTDEKFRKEEADRLADECERYLWAIHDSIGKEAFDVFLEALNNAVGAVGTQFYNE